MVLLKQLDARVPHFPLVTQLHPHSEHMVLIIGDDLLAQSQERQLVLIVHHLLLWSAQT